MAYHLTGKIWFKIGSSVLFSVAFLQVLISIFLVCAPLPDLQPSLVKLNLLPTQKPFEFCNKKAHIQLSLDPILQQIENHRRKSLWSWIKDHLQQIWPHWVQAARNMTLSKSTEINVKKVLVVPGVLGATEFAKNSSLLSGGPQGDLFQWSNLIAALHVLGHRVELDGDFNQVGRNLRYDVYKVAQPSSYGDSDNCLFGDVDLIYADIIAMKVFPEDARNKYSCKFRVLDAYGTEAMFNSPQYALKHSFRSNYGQLHLHLKQFYTFYPHTPDNTFLGFALPPLHVQVPKKKFNMALLYGKDGNYFTNHTSYIKVVSTEYAEVHSTVYNASTLPNEVLNHGVLNASGYQALLANSKFLLGVGLPLESTGVIEALQHGCIFINPKFNIQWQQILQHLGKPTSRKLSSQIPFLERFVGPPYVYTIDINNTDAVRRTLSELANTTLPPIHLHEFTMTGFLQRLRLYLANQNFCGGNSTWPPVSLTRIFIGRGGLSCAAVCHSEQMTCDPTYFHVFNREKTFLGFNKTCKSVFKTSAIVAPAYVTKQQKCVLQNSTYLYSCAGAYDGIERICPCRTLIIENVKIY